MKRELCRPAGARSVVLLAAAMAIVVCQTPGDAQGVRRDDQNLTYVRGQSVVPIYYGWDENPDGTFNMYFSYINRNWQEEVDIPIGPDNNVQPAPFGPDAGQPTHFLPRQNRLVFQTKVPKDFGTKEIVWTLTSHGQTNRAYGVLKPGYLVDDVLIQHEFGGQGEFRGRKPPTIKVEGEKERNVKVGQSVQLAAVATDDAAPQARGRRGGGGPPSPTRGSGGEIGPGQVGGDFVRNTSAGLWFLWIVYRGPSGPVQFDPPMPFKAWEDQRGGSPWAPGFQVPPPPPGNKWVYNVTFSEPGTYVLRAVAHSPVTFAYENITFNVTR